MAVDDDECLAGTDNCDSNAQCTNTVGSFICACNTGYSGDGVSCTVSTTDETSSGSSSNITIIIAVCVVFFLTVVVVAISIVVVILNRSRRSILDLTKDSR